MSNKFRSRLTKVRQSASRAHSLSLTGPNRPLNVPETGPSGYLKKLIGPKSEDTDIGVFFNTENSEGIVSSNGQDVIYYNSVEGEGSEGLLMRIFVNGFYRATVEFSVKLLNHKFGYSVGLGYEISEYPFTASKLEPFLDFQIESAFQQGDVNLTISSIELTTPLPTPGPTIPEPTPEPTFYVLPPTPEPTSELPPLPEPTSTELPEFIGTPLPTETPAATPVATPAATPAATPEGTPNPTATETPIPTASVTPGATPEPTPEPTPIPPTTTPSTTPSSTPEPTPSVTPSPTETLTATPSPTETLTPTPSTTPSSTPEPTPSTTPSSTPEPTPSPTPSSTPEPTPSTTPSSTPEPTPSVTPSPTETLTATPTTTPSSTPEPTPSVTPSPTETLTATPTTTPSSTPSPTPTPTENESVGYDDASNYTSWTTGSDRGTGFQPWTFTVNGNGGHFLGSSALNGMGDINTGGNSFGMYGNTSGTDYAYAFRKLNSPLTTGLGLSAQIAVAFRNGYKGFSVYRDSSLLDQGWYFNVQNNAYDANGTTLGWTYSDSRVFTFTAKQLTSNSFRVDVTSGTDSHSSTVITGVVHGFRFYIGGTEQSGTEPRNNLYFNKLGIGTFTPDPTPSVTPSPTPSTTPSPTPTATTITGLFVSESIVLNVTDNAGNYNFDQLGATSNPTLSCYRETNYTFNANTLTSNPIAFRVALGDTSTAVDGMYGNDPSSGKTNGEIYFNPTQSTPNTIYYQSTLNSSMSGVINILTY